jgi:hypothetical protein
MVMLKTLSRAKTQSQQAETFSTDNILIDESLNLCLALEIFVGIYFGQANSIET